MARTMGKGRIARAAIAAALSGTMAFGGLMSVAAPAFAVDQPVTFNIKKNDGSDSTVYNKAYKIFSATAIDNTQNNAGASAEGVIFTETATSAASNLTPVKNAIIAFVDGTNTLADRNGASKSYLQWLIDEGLLPNNTDVKPTDAAGKAIYEAPANIARFIGSEIGYSNFDGADFDTINPTLPNQPNIVADTSFANKLATAIEGLAASGTDVVFSVDPIPTAGDGHFEMTSSGYYLVTGDDADVETNYVPPMWLPVNTDANSASFKGSIDLAEKVNQPTVNKKAKDDDAVDFKKVVAAGKGQSVTFELIGELPVKGNGLFYKDVYFEDIMPQGLSLVSNPRVVDYEDGSATPTTLQLDQDYEVKTTDTGFTVKMLRKDDTTDTDNFTIDASKSHRIVVEYDVTLNDNASMGKEGLNTNKVIFHYDDKEKTSDSESSIATFGIDLTKVDQNDTKLKDAGFTVQKYDGDQSTADAFLQESGKFEAKEKVWNTSSDGKIALNQIDEGKYLFTEKNPPVGFKSVDPFILEISTVKNEVTGEIEKVNASFVSGTDANGKAINTPSNLSVSAVANTATGIVELKVTDENEEARLPITGMTPSQLGTIMGLLLVAGGAAMVMRRRQADKAQA